MMADAIALEARGLKKTFNGKRAVDGADLAVARGEIVGFLGPNGAGKTTVMNMIVGLLKPDAGQITLLGETGSSRRLRARIGFLQEKPRIYPDMTARAYLGVFAGLYAVPDAARRIGEVIERVGIGHAADRPLAGYSRGMQQRACLARVLLHRPEFIVLDEPTLGLDPAGVRDVRQIFRELRDGGATLLFSSHQLAEMERLCDGVILMNAGRVVASGRQEDLLPPSGRAFTVEILEDTAGAVGAIAALPSVRLVEATARHRLRLELTDAAVGTAHARRGEVARLVAHAGFTVLSVVLHGDSLEDVFLALTGGGADDGTTRRHGGIDGPAL